MTPRRIRQGLTLLEVMVALVVLETALLGMAANGVAALRRAEGAVARARAARLALRRLERLRAAPCAAAAGGSARWPGAIVESWTVVGDGAAIVVRDSLTHPSASATGRLALVVVGRIACGTDAA